jgi:long-chain acyl-CoA synthetase
MLLETSGRKAPSGGAVVQMAEVGNARDMSCGAPVRRMSGARLNLPDEQLLTIPALLRHVATQRTERVALRVKRRGIYRETTWSELLEQVTRIGLGLMALGIARGDRVAIVGDPSPEWLLADFAAQSLGAISFGLYPTSSRDEAEFVLRHGGAAVLIAQDQEHVDKVLPMLDRLPDLRKLVVIDDSHMFGYRHAALMALRELIDLGGKVTTEDFVARGRTVRPDDPATIVYTSGTSADPKGALYTHRALITLGHQFHAFAELEGRDDVRSVVHLPLNHLYERANTPQGMLAKGIVPHFPDEAERFLETLYEVAPQHHASVPRYWSKLASRIIVGVENASPVKRAAYHAAMKVGQAYRRRRWNGAQAPALGALYTLARLIVFDRMLKKLGLHRVRLALSSGAPLPAEVQALWQVWGVNLKNLYGQTESGVVTAQFAAFPPPGSVGRAYPGNEISLGADDEIICASPGSFAGYWSDAAASAEMRQPDGIRTGDVGVLDARGELTIVDRKKDIVITAGGKNLSPSRIETTLKASPYVAEASVIGEGRKYLTALIEIDVGTVSEWARARGVTYSTYRSLATNASVNELLAHEIEEANARLGRVEQVKAFRILDRELDPEIEGEAVTATRKIKRAVLQQQFAYLIDDMYANDEEARIARQLTH